MRILVTGGAGFIGSHLATHLAWKPAHEVELVQVADRRRVGEWFPHHHDRIQAFGVEIGRNFMNRWPLSSPRPDFIYHLASTVGVRNVLADPKEAIENIIESTRAVLSLGIPGMYFSTSEVYGRNDEVLTEDAEIRLTGKTRWSYAAAKLVCEWLALEAGWKVVRPFNVVGPRQNMAYGAVLPTFVNQCIAGEPLTVYGNGSQVRTFIDVRDFVQIVDELRDVDFDVVNVGGIHRKSIRDLAFEVGWVLGREYSIKYVPYETAYPPGFEECTRRVPDLTKLHSLLGGQKSRPLSESIESIAREVTLYLYCGTAP